MSNKLMITWGVLVIFILSSIFIIGVYYERNYEYIEADKKVKKMIKQYLLEEEVNLSNLDSLTVDSDFLRKKGYEEEIIVSETNCEFVATIKKYYIFNSYKIKYNCLKEILE